jgi:putative zinc finger/helix-turn-helix YgiT family protein
MTVRLPCSSCLASRDFEIVEREEKISIAGREIRFQAQFSRCTTCGTEYEAAGQLDANLDAAREVYARLYESPTPEALVALRSRYGASQKAFGSILGFGELTMNSYEKGATPDATNRLLLKLADKPFIFKTMYELNKSKIGALQRRRIENSEGFDGAAWTGLEALSSLLTSVQKDKIKLCAKKNNRSIPEQIASYTCEASFKDYSQLMAEATWPDKVPTKIPTAVVSPMALQQAAS